MKALKSPIQKHSTNPFVPGILFWLITFSGNAGVFGQAFPNLGNDTTLDVACWNIEWFGNTSNGPTDENLQFDNVKYLIDRTGMDVFALAEISDPTAYSNLSAALTGKYETYISSFSQTQKTGIYWRKTMFRLIPNLSFNLSLNSGDLYQFASRPPLQVALQTLGGTKTDTLFFLVLHMKAFSDLESYNRRVAASGILKNYLQTYLPGKKYIVLGDWNDDLDQSIYNNLNSPYKNFLDAGFQFPSKELTDAGKSSYAFGTNMIDHLMNSTTIDSFYFVGSARVFDDAPTYCTGFSNNTSDHYPVYARYNWTRLTTSEIPSGWVDEKPKKVPYVYPNPAKQALFITSEEPLNKVSLYGVDGSLQMQILNLDRVAQIDLSSLKPGFYVLVFQTQSGTSSQRIGVE